MSAVMEDLLSRLDRVRHRRPGHWISACPAHEDRGPSLSIAEADGGTALIHCFAGCTPIEVLAAVGLTLGDLFPDKFEHRGGKRPPLSGRDVLLVLDHESLMVSELASRLTRGDAVTAADLDRMAEVRKRIARVREVVRSA